MIHVSEKKLAANRANGALSHGPKTPEGKARSAQNAVRHGLLGDISRLSGESLQGYSDHVQGYYDQFRPKSEFELGLVEEMAIASWHLRRAFAIENQMMENEMNACNHARNQLDRIALAFGNLADSRQLNLIQRYQTRLHDRHSRTLRDFILIRKAFPPSETGDPGSCEVPASCIPTLPDPKPAPPPAPSTKSLASPLRNEPKSTFPLNEFLPTEPANQPGAASTPPALAPEQQEARAPQPGSAVLSGKHRSNSEECCFSLHHSLSLGDSAVKSPPTLARQIPNPANHLAPSGQPQGGSH